MMSKIYIPKAHEPSIWRVDSVGDAVAVVIIGIFGVVAVCWGTLL